MNRLIPDYLSIKRNELGQGIPMSVRILGDRNDIARDMATSILRLFDEITTSQRNPTFIVPVGPVDQFPVLAALINASRRSFREVMFINMDEYLTEDDQWIPHEHPLSFKAFMDRKFYDLIEPDLAPRSENRLLPDPNAPDQIAAIIESRGGVDACFGGIGINGHIAFNEPPEAPDQVAVEEFADRPTRLLDLTRETMTINSVTVGGELSLIPRRAVTVGMREILASRRLRFYCNRPWQRSVVRRVLHGPITAACPASLLRTHPDAELVCTEEVATPPEIQLR